MHPIIYDVAVSLDGFISGSAGDISKFAQDGPVVDDYHARLGTYKTVFMGRNTYEFGYDFGLKPGDNPYPHMTAFVFSKTLRLPEGSDVSVVHDASPDAIRELASASDGPIYLCGGGEFAGWMLANGLIDKLILKRAPCVLGQGVSLFGSKACDADMSLMNTTSYNNGYVLEEYAVG